MTLYLQIRARRLRAEASLERSFLLRWRQAPFLCLFQSLKLGTA
jgi:hypothetical protein